MTKTDDEGNTVDFEDFWSNYLQYAQPTRFPFAPPQDYRINSQHLNGNYSTEQNEVLQVKHDGDVSDATLAAAWALVISQHALTEDVIFGLARPDNGQETIPIRLQASGSNETTADLVANAESSLKKTSTFSSGSSILRRIRAIDTTCNNACTFLSILRIAKQSSSDSVPLTARNDAPSPSILVNCHQTSKLTELSIEADAAVYPPAITGALLRQFGSAIHSLLGAKRTDLDRTQLVHEHDIRELESWQHDLEPVPTNPYLHALVEEQARLQPLSVAVGQTDSVMTYAELDEGANALAKHLLSLNQSGQATSGNVAIFFSKSAFAVLSMFAVLKAGGAFAPIDTSWPPKRIAKVLESAQIKVILCSEDQRAKLKDFTSLNVVAVTPKLVYELKKSSQGTPFSPPKFSSESPAYIMHTSGSTGQPKGVVISHRAITTSVHIMARYFDMSPSVRTLQFNAFTFDVAMADLWVTLAYGGRVCMPTDEERFGLNEFILAERCNFAFITPSIASTIDPDIPRKHFRRLATIGEAVKPEFMKKFAPQRAGNEDDEGDFVLCDTWGPTEASVMNTGTRPITVDDDGQTLSQRAGNIGMPVGCAMFIVSADDRNKLAPTYAPGEIAIVGPTLASGYWGDEEKTQAVFKTDLEWAKDSRWTERYGEETMKWVYLTGDIGRYSEDGDGAIVFMYRKGGYMKVNGLRIDPGEVEAAVTEIGSASSKDREKTTPSWRSNVVSVLERVVADKEQQMLVCFLPESEAQGNPGTGCTKLEASGKNAELFQHVAKGLKDLVPEYMIPGAFVLIDKMPYTTSLKLDRKALLATLEEMEWNDIVKQHAISSDM